MSTESGVSGLVVPSEVKPVEPAPYVHVLLKTRPTTRQSFEEWLKRWDETTDVDDRIGLLHSLIWRPVGENKNRSVNNCWCTKKTIPFLLEVADGHHRGHGLSTPSKCSWDRDMNEQDKALRQLVAKKALSVLCQTFFGYEKSGGQPQWLWMLEDSVVLEKVIWFFRAESGEYTHHSEIVNCPYSTISSEHNTSRDLQMVAEFVSVFAKLGWTLHKFWYQWHDRHGYGNTINDKFISLRPFFVDVLNYMGETSWLLPYIKDDAPSRNRLKEIALNENLWLPPENGISSNVNRKATTLEEAAFGGSKAAQVLLLYEINAQVARRFADMSEKAQVLKDGERRRAKLVELGKAQAILAQEIIELGGDPTHQPAP